MGNKKKRILAVTGGGHVHFGPGIRRLVEGSKKRGWDILGSLYGWRGVDVEIGQEQIIDLGYSGERKLEKMQYAGASPIFSSRRKPDPSRVRKIMKKYGITHVVPYGGDDTLSVNPGVPIIGWPKTMDNNHGPQSDKDDLSPGTYFSIGYPTAVERAGRETETGHSNAQTNSSVHLIIPFGRNQDFVSVGATAYGCADFMVPGENVLYFEDFYDRIQDARLRNAETYKCDPFAVVVIPEGVNKGDAAGLFEGYAPAELINYNRKYAKKDMFGHLKIMPEVIAPMAREALIKRSRDEKDENRRIEKVSYKILTYALRDGPAIEIDRKMGAAMADKCLELIEEGKENVMATVKWDYEKNEFTTDSIPIKDVVNERFVKGTGFFDYDGTWRPTEKYLKYAGRFLGSPPSRDSLVFDPGKYKKACPI